MLGPSIVNPDAAAKLAEEARRPHGPLVQLGLTVKAKSAERETVEAA